MHCEKKNRPIPKTDHMLGGYTSMQKWAMSTLLIIAFVVGIGVMFSEINQRAQERAAEAEEAKVPSLKIAASNWKFDKEEYTVKQGETLKVSFRNAEGIHAVEITGYNVHLDQNNPTQEITFDKPGEYEIKCSLMCGLGHDTMISKLIVQ